MSEELRRSYEEAMLDAFEEGKAIVDEAVKKAETRRRFHVDSKGCTVIEYVAPVHRDAGYRRGGEA